MDIKGFQLFWYQLKKTNEKKIKGGLFSVEIMKNCFPT